MKILTVCAFLGVLGFNATAQPCTTATARAEIAGNSIHTLVGVNGNLFTDGQRSRFVPFSVPNGNGPGTIFTAGLWLGGVDPAGNLKLSACQYESQGNPGADFWPGPLADDGTTEHADCLNWDTVFQVKATDITAFLTSLPTLFTATAIGQYPEILGWPGKGNPHFFTLYNFDLPNQPLAPFHDADSDGLYDPMHGDYPVVDLDGLPAFVPSEFTWSIYNDQGGGQSHPVTSGIPFRFEIHLSVWVFDCDNQPELDRTLFTAHKMIYKGTEPVDSMYFGIWADFDIGCPDDDYIGTLPGQNSFFAYNASALDRTICDVPFVFTGEPPVQSATFLNTSLDHTVYFTKSSPIYPAGTSDPTQPEQFYRLLTGHFRDGTPITAAGAGYQTNGPLVNYIFPGDPVDSSAWTACSVGLNDHDFRNIGSHKLGRLEPGDVHHLVTAWTYHPHPILPCGIGSTSADIAAVQALYDAGFAGVCSPVSTQEIAADAVQLQPNPAADHFTLTYGDLPVRAVRLYNAQGRLVYRSDDLPAGRADVAADALAPGVYFVELSAAAGVWRGKVLINR